MKLVKRRKQWVYNNEISLSSQIKTYYRKIAIVECREMPDGRWCVWHCGYDGETIDNGDIYIKSGIHEDLIFYNGFLTGV